MKRLSKTSSGWGSKRSGVGHVSDAKFASLYEEADVDDDDERQPGKTLRMLSSSKLGGVNQQLQKMFVCNKCGKGFQSSKALCGHMACHSVKEKALRKKKQFVIMDSQSDTESGAKNLRRRSRRARCMKYDNHAANSRSKLDDYSNFSSEASGVEQEQEEVAISLMMLSRDSGNWGGLHSIADSSENNSVVLEARSVNTNLMKDGLRRFEYDVDETMRKFGCKKIETLGDSKSGYVRNEAENVGIDVKFDDLRKNKRDRGLKAERNSSLKQFKSSKGPKMELQSRMCAENGSYSATNQHSNVEMYRRFEHKALIHSRSRSHHAFNVNVAGNHESFKAASTHESSENIFETDGSPDFSKGKGVVQHFFNNVGDYRKMGNKHECPIGFKVFRSVQALGGHRRVHLAERSADINNCDEVSAIFKRNGTQLHDFIDLNLPAPMEDEELN